MSQINKVPVSLLRGSSGNWASFWRIQKSFLLTEKVKLLTVICAKQTKREFTVIFKF